MSHPEARITTTKNKSLLSTPNPFEQKFGYHRAIRRGPFIVVSGTTALRLTTPITTPDNANDESTGDESKVEHPGDAYSQALLAMNRCVDAVTKLGGRREDVVRVRMFVARGEDCEGVGRAFRGVLGGGGGRDTGSGGEGGDGGEVRGGHSEGREDLVGAAATMIVVGNDGFVDADMLVEVEVDAYVV
ncbi:hypothetical protein PMZ80_010743 [Knufia obscura]|uniref:YjgF-like protein n=1 Tax=Knufia obscura TaxID=1635080 RepID=A0ABR0R9X8_9EURO|nr:hypothetical protein PMZ80_010743 [Knufia obscura]